MKLDATGIATGAESFAAVPLSVAALGLPFPRSVLAVAAAVGIIVVCFAIPRRRKA